MAMNKLNNKGYMLVEIILASVIAFGVAYSVINLTIKLKNKNDDLLVETQVVTDQSIITNKLMKYIKEENKDFDCDLVTIDDKTIKYKNDIIDIVNDYTTIGEITRNCNDKEISIYIPLTVKQLSNKNFDVNINYKLVIPDSFTNNNMLAICNSYGFLGNTVQLDEVINFNKISSDTNGKGVYMVSSTKDDDHPVCYYRGAVNNNNLIFANFCWKIVRTTETGGLKILYSGLPENGECKNTTGKTTQLSTTSSYNYTYSNAKFVGYMYNTTISSDIKNKIDAWYRTNISNKGFGDYLENTIWCNDRSDPGDGSKDYAPKKRLAGSQKTPSLDCPQLADRYTIKDTTNDNAGGNGLLTYPVALLTADEVAFAGALFKTLNTTYYLYTTNANWYTMSPYYFGTTAARVWQVGPDSCNEGKGFGPCEYVGGTAIGIRPAVSLKPGIRLTGFGTAEEPYSLVE